MVNNGRPRDSGIDDAIRAEAARVVIEHGYRGASIDAIARAAGTTRPAVYRRYSSLAHIVLAALAQRQVFAPELGMGSLSDDLAEIAHCEFRFLADPLARRALLGLLDDGAADESLFRQLADEFFAPRTRAIQQALDEAVDRGEAGRAADAQTICDLLLTPMLMRTVLPGIGSITPQLMHSLLSAALAYAREADITVAQTC